MTDTILQKQLKNWAVKHECTRQCVNDILDILTSIGHDLAKDSRTLLHTKKQIKTRPLGDGQYIYYGIKFSIQKVLSGRTYWEADIRLIINVDGLPLFKSSSMELWPILIQFGNFDPVAVALYGGHKKPPIEEFLKYFVNEIILLTSNPLVFNNNTYFVYLFAITCDAPVRALLKGIVQHTGYYACERCTKKGFVFKNRVCYSYAEENIFMRTTEAFQSFSYGLSDLSGKCHQTPISVLLPLNVNMINVFPLDYMHMVCLGVTRRILNYFKGNYKGIFNGRLSSTQIMQVSQNLLLLRGKLPSEFIRQPRSLVELDRWKATELRSFLLYYGIVVLKGICNPNMYKHFLSLSLAVRVLCEENKDSRIHYLNFSKKLLNYFVTNSQEHYGKSFFVYNVHGLLHIADDVEFYEQPLDAISAFQFENFFQKLKQLVRSQNNPVAQLTKRFSEIEISKEKNVISTKISTKAKDSCFLVQGGVVFILNKLKDENFQCDYYGGDVLERFFDLFIDSKQLYIYMIKGNIKPLKCVKKVNELLRKCCCFPYKNGNVIIPLLSNVTGH